MDKDILYNIADILSNVGNGVKVIDDSYIGIVKDDEHAIQRCIEKFNLSVFITENYSKPVLPIGIADIDDETIYLTIMPREGFDMTDRHLRVLKLIAEDDNYVL